MTDTALQIALGVVSSCLGAAIVFLCGLGYKYLYKRQQLRKAEKLLQRAVGSYSLLYHVPLGDAECETVDTMLVEDIQAYLRERK